MSASESALGRHGIASVLEAGALTLSEDQALTFTKYIRLVLPIDGSVFWVRASQANPSALYNAAQYNAAQYNQPPSATYANTTLTAKGSLHYVTAANQNEGDASTLNRFIFTSMREIEDFNDVSPTVMWMGEFQGQRFSFSRRESFYEQARIWHYVGDAVFASIETPIVDAPTLFTHDPVVSNCLPLWLNLATPYLPILGLNGLPWPIFPSFLVPQNLRPPFIAVHVFPESTQAISSAPILNRTQSHSQLVQEKVRVTTHGLRNADVLDFCDYVQSQFGYNRQMGIMNMPVPRDEKQTQVELGALAQKKTIEYQVNYLHAVARDIARQVITSAVVSYTLGGYVAPRTGRWNEFLWNDGTVWS